MRFYEKTRGEDLTNYVLTLTLTTQVTSDTKEKKESSGKDLNFADLDLICGLVSSN